MKPLEKSESSCPFIGFIPITMRDSRAYKIEKGKREGGSANISVSVLSE